MSRCPTCMRALDPIQDVADRTPSVATHPLFGVLHDLHGWTAADLRSSRSSRQISYVRQVGYWVARNVFRLSYTEVASLFNRKDHSTVMEGVKKVNGSEEMLASAQRVLKRLEAA